MGEHVAADEGHPTARDRLMAWGHEGKAMPHSVGMPRPQRSLHCTKRRWRGASHDRDPPSRHACHRDHERQDRGGSGGPMPQVPDNPQGTAGRCCSGPSCVLQYCARAIRSIPRVTVSRWTANTAISSMYHHGSTVPCAWA